MKQVTCTKEHLQRSRYLKSALVYLKPDTFLLVHNAGAGDTKVEELTPSVMDNSPEKEYGTCNAVHD